ncbi:SsrA-binding protein SmpB [Candidatus Kinetoplastidibacterium crithidiae]|uniref:SsrA-binding protein n=1 Tax=Candidatus Kinetoplastidibacterium crithidiae TCC036E TaxID=1208918 RepID=M1LWM8_9PROT|nr:SsrA-binding protein SmpB [Candidatus Kinetoplastibacterium crithidii]AFZ82724.1 SsrA-binding protein [Candidatus Kinetoplastibacterium crithidii (ex Angomonas deanei ATCC 30255)]AGF47624.1 SsrA-binding protein [Candidatus Kinetoplastibacterium crithidii TCC036E]
MKITENRKAYHDYFIEDKFEAGIVLQGWEVKAIRSKNVSIKEGYIIIKNGEIYIIGMHISPLKTISNHITPDPYRTRKLLLNNNEIKKLIGKVDQKGFTLIPLNLHYKNNLIKLDMALGKGKKMYDKRNDSKEKESKKEQERFLKSKLKTYSNNKD